MNECLNEPMGENVVGFHKISHVHSGAVLNQ